MIGNFRSISKGVVAAIVIIIIIVALVGVYYAIKKPSVVTTTSSTISTTTTTTSSTISTTTTTTSSTTTSSPISVTVLSPVAPSSYTTVAGTPINFVLSSFTPSSNRYALFYAGNGTVINTTSQYESVNYTYPGHYLVYYEVYQNGMLIGSSSTNLIEITVAPNIPSSLSGLVSVPVITFNTTDNPTAPIFTVGEKIYLIGGFLQPPYGQNMTIYEYIWNFGNGTSITIPAINSTEYALQVIKIGSGNLTYIEPKVNPIKISYNKQGLYAISLTIVTKNIYTNGTYNYTTIQTIAVQSSQYPYSIFKPLIQVPNPGTIIVAENQPGGPFSFDPQIDYESVGAEIMYNIFSTLVTYNGNNMTSFLPMAAEYLPTVGNWSQRNLYGGIAPNYSVYTFKIRPNLKFSNGDNLTAYDVWYSEVRDLLCAGGTPFTPGWILAQFLIPNYTPGLSIVTSPNDTEGFNEIMNAITYDNQTNTVTFHLVKSAPPTIFYVALGDIEGQGILDAKWLEQVGAGINFTPQGFYNYESECNLGNYNTQVQWDPISSGPYMIKSYAPGESIVLVPNPYYPGLPNIPKPNNTVIIYWVKDPNTAYEMFASGQADIVSNMPPQYIPSFLSLESKGQAVIYQFPTLTNWVFAFNPNVNVQMLKQINPLYNMPSYYFANPLVREAYAYAFNYTEFINDILGNSIYHVTFGIPYCGGILPGYLYYVPPSELSGCPTFNLTYAKELLIKSGMYNVSVNFPVFIQAGDTQIYTAVLMWSQALHNIDPNINIIPTYIPWSLMNAYMSPGYNPMPIYFVAWIPDYARPDDVFYGLYQSSGWATYADSFNPSYFENVSSYLNSTGEINLGALIYNESIADQKLNILIQEADQAEFNGYPNASLLFKEAEQQAVNLYMYVYLYIQGGFWIVKPYIHPYQNNIALQENPLDWGGGAGDSFYPWWVKS
ncbi:ABC-type oligopeptide transport system, periplasmic component [Caldisphaera lagunensis DSM 15908]|uniref:ABC-type oligopeptide transport system, periplasmic component n=1 Tax=Caldisphaera lagunensis (strain DSM 15908 / JCM 11604 / ANMR 0165 / IC-154) TaxID=1056495 RepID=L0AAB7_CALLD|nr:ABC-type oligopeptide transport system, periplasmic component [Caldisphaera lagunensis DSM 15908]